MIAPDLKQNIFVMIYSIIVHNFFAIVFSCGILVGILLSIIKPTRKSVLFLLGNSILLFAFEYNKHIRESLRDQTIGSLITLKRYYKLEWFINVFTIKILPVLLYITGLTLVVISVYLYLIKKNSHKK